MPPDERSEADDGADEGEIRDELPSDLDAGGYVGPYMFPNNNRRRIPGFLYLILGAISLVVFLATRGSGTPLVNGGFVVAAVALALMGGYQLVAGWNLDVDERDALVLASKEVGFPVGHASAQLGWRGLLSRPTWRILLYSSEESPKYRGFVMVDGVDGRIVDWFTEPNPEDWSELEKR